MTKLIPVQRIANKILFLHDEKVLMDRDLAELYGVETRVLNQAVSRDIKRFPPDFMFTLTRDEIMRISQIDILRNKILKARTPLNACPVKYEVNFIGAKPVYLGRSLFHRGFRRKTSAANLTGAAAKCSLEMSRTGIGSFFFIAEKMLRCQES